MRSRPRPSSASCGPSNSRTSNTGGIGNFMPTSPLIPPPPSHPQHSTNGTTSHPLNTTTSVPMGSTTTFTVPPPSMLGSNEGIVGCTAPNGLVNSAVMLLRRHSASSAASMTRSVPTNTTTLGGGPPTTTTSSSISSGLVVNSANPPQPLPNVIRRKPEERAANPERLNLDRKRLTMCPLLENEEKLKLLNFQNNCIAAITNLQGLPNLVFLDLYNNCIGEITGLESVPSLRVLMLGKNRISVIRGLDKVPRLDVLDLHNNLIERIENVNHLYDLRVLNLAGNRIGFVDGISMTGLRSLAEINLRRNTIDVVVRLESIPTLQRVFLSANQISSFDVVTGILQMPNLVELSLDGNPVCGAEHYRSFIIHNGPHLRHVDMRRVTDEERKTLVAPMISNMMDALTTAKDNGKGKDTTMGSKTQLQPTPPPAGGSTTSNNNNNTVTTANTTASSTNNNNGGAGYSKVITSLVEYDVGNQRLQVTGANADSTLDRMPPDAITAVYFESIPIERAAKIFGPKLQRFTTVATYRFSNNGLHSLQQLQCVAQLPRVLHLEIVRNDIVTTMPVMFPLFCYVMLPMLQSLNGKVITITDVEKAKRMLKAIPQNIPGISGVSSQRNVGTSSSDVVVSTLLNPLTLSSSDVSAASRAAESHVEHILQHSVIVDKKSRALEGQWNSVMKTVVHDTLRRTQDPLKHDDIYKMT